MIIKPDFSVKDRTEKIKKALDDNYWIFRQTTNEGIGWVVQQAIHIIKYSTNSDKKFNMSIKTLCDCYLHFDKSSELNSLQAILIDLATWLGFKDGEFMRFSEGKCHADIRNYLRKKMREEEKISTYEHWNLIA